MIAHDYKAEPGGLLRECERPLLARLRQPSARPAEEQDWLDCQRVLNRLTAMLVNGHGAFSRKRPLDWVYRFLWPAPGLWRGSARFEPVGPHTQRLLERLGPNGITFGSLYEALREAEAFLLEPPKQTSTEPRRYAVPDRSPRCHPLVQALRERLVPVQDDVSVYVHGSMATGDYTPFSDVDDLVILHHSSWSSPARFREVVRCLEKAARLCQRTDPLQHHGHWVLLDFDLVCLNEGVMPLVVLEQAVRVAGRPEVTARVRKDLASFAPVLWHLIQEVRCDALVMLQGPVSLFQLKNLISSLSLLPALTFQVRGQTLDKKTAILRSGEIFSDQARPAVSWTTQIRAEWATCPGSDCLAALGCLNRSLPFRRDALEDLARRFSPSLRPDQVPFLTDAVAAAIFHLTNESAAHLARALGS